MEILISSILILAVTGLVHLANKVLPFGICPICAGVAGAWFLVSIGLVGGVLYAEGWKLFTAIAMGGSIVGIAYKGEKRFQWAPRHIFLFRLPVIVIGFIAVYMAQMYLSLFVLLLEFMFLVVITYVYFVMPHRKSAQPESRRVEELEKKMEDCC